MATTPRTDDQTLAVDISPAGVMTITLNRPDKLNAVNDALSYALIDALKTARKDPAVRAILLTGSGRGFCAGQDLESRSIGAEKGEIPHLGQSIRNRYMPIITLLRTIEKPVVGAVNGVAAGAGASMAFACDVRIAAESASFIQAFIKVGLIPDSGACFMLPRLVGLGRAMELMMSGRKVKADEALQMGLVNQVVPDDELMTTALALATDYAQGPTKAFGLLKRATNRAMDCDLETYLAYEADVQEIAGRTADFAEGVAAFVQKRPANFTGA